MKHSMTPVAAMRGILIGAAMLFAPQIFAVQTFTVNSTLDGLDDDTSDGLCHTAANTCTLRAAVMQANRSSGTGATIMLPAGTFTLTRPAANSDGEDNGDLNLTAPPSGSNNAVIAIVGAGATKTIIDANQIDRVFHVEPTRTATIKTLTIRNGYADTGGGILNEGTLTLDHIILNLNFSFNAGGGINNYAYLKIQDSSVVLNITSYGGGGIFSSGSMILSASTIAFNTAGGGGGLYSNGDVVMTDSTIADNKATVNGGGIYDIGTSFNIYNSTIAYNDANSNADSTGYGGGAYIGNGATLNLHNSLLVGNYVRGDPIFGNDCYGDGTLVPYGRNLTTTIGFCNVATSSSWALLNSLALLGPLQDNGGPTQTIALLSGSNAIDTAGACVDYYGNPILTDQRGYARIIGSACDIGAYELDPDRIFSNGFE